MVFVGLFSAASRLNLWRTYFGRRGGAQCCGRPGSNLGWASNAATASGRPHTLQGVGVEGRAVRGRADGRQRVGLDMFGLLERRHRDFDKGTQPTRVPLRDPQTDDGSPRQRRDVPHEGCDASNARRARVSPSRVEPIINHLLKCEWTIVDAGDRRGLPCLLPRASSSFRRRRGLCI